MQQHSLKKLFIGAALAALLAPLATVAGAQPPSSRGSLARRTAADYRARARYPESSRALAPGEADPIRAERVPAPHSIPSPAGGPLLTVWAGQVSFEHPAPVDLFATLTPGRSAQAAGAKTVAVDRVTGEIVDQAGAVVGHVVYLDDGQGVDERAGDGLFSARFVMPEDAVPALAGSYLVKIEAVTADGTVVRGSDGFLYSHPAAQLTGGYRDAVVEGNLVVGAEVEVAEAGRFHLAATLYSMKGEPVGWAQTAAELTPGRHWLELTYYGLLFHDRKVAGPFRLGSVALATTTGMPNALNDLVENAYQTHAVKLDEMRSTPFGDPGLLGAAARLETEAALAEAAAGH